MYEAGGHDENEGEERGRTKAYVMIRTREKQMCVMLKDTRLLALLTRLQIYS